MGSDAGFSIGDAMKSSFNSLMKVYCNSNNQACETCGKPKILVEEKIAGESYQIPKPNCDCWKKRKMEEAERDVKQLLESSGMVRKYQKIRLRDLKVDSGNSSGIKIVNHYIKQVDESPGINLFIFGEVGTGKTYLACAAGIEIFINRCLSKARKIGLPTIQFCDIVNFLNLIKDSFSSYRDRAEVLGKYTNAEILILDDLGKEKPSDWTIQELYGLINTRYLNDKSTIVTSNYDLEGLIKKLSVNGDSITAESVMSRLSENCMKIKLSGKDRRRSW